MTAALQPRLLPHVTALLARLATATMPNGALIPVGNHRNVMSTAAPPRIVAPAIVLYLRTGGQTFGSVGCTDTDAELSFQITCIGLNADQAFAVADAAHTALVASPLAVADRAIWRLRRTFFGPSAERDETISPPLYYVTPEYRMWSTPSVEES